MTWIYPVRQRSPDKNPVIDNVHTTFIFLDWKLDHIIIICNILPEPTYVADNFGDYGVLLGQECLTCFYWLITHAD